VPTFQISVDTASRSTATDEELPISVRRLKIVAREGRSR
jgi:hypothetical protein